MNIALWIVAGLLAVAYVASGGLKVIMSKQKTAASGPATEWVEDSSPGAVKTIGVLEVLGGLGLTLPAAFGIASELVPLAALGLAMIMVGAATPHQPARVPARAGGPDLTGPDLLRGLGPVRSRGVRGLIRPGVAAPDVGQQRSPEPSRFQALCMLSRPWVSKPRPFHYENVPDVYGPDPLPDFACMWCARTTRARVGGARGGARNQALYGRDYLPVSNHDRFLCGFCGEPTDDDPRYVRLDVSWDHIATSQTIGAHHACLVAALQPRFPLAVEGPYE